MEQRSTIAESQRGKSPIIRNLMPGLTERGKIKIGKKGESRPTSGGGTFQLPVKLDHFIVTTLQRDNTGNFVVDADIHKLIGDKPKSIPVFLLFDDIALNFQCRYACFLGRTLWCSGDGEAAFRLAADKKTRQEVACPCERQNPAYENDREKCKINGTLSVVIRDAKGVGGVWKFRTTGYNSTVGILSSLSLIRSLTGGYLAGLPLNMTIQPKVATNPKDGKATTIQVVGIEYAGNLSDLQKTTLEIASKNAEFRARLVHIEAETRKLISADVELIDQAADIQDEFYPEGNGSPQLATPGAASGTAQTQAAASVSAGSVPTGSPETGSAAPAAASNSQEPVKQRRTRKKTDAQPLDAPAAGQAPADAPAPAEPTPPVAPAPQMAQPMNAPKISLF